MTIELDPVRVAPADQLRHLAVEIHLPGDPTWDAARQAWNLAFDQRPAAVARPADAAEVAEVVRVARAAGLYVAPQSTGHNAMPLGDLSDTVLLRTTRLDTIEVDPEARICRVGSGVVWGPVVEAVAEYGLMALHGSSPDVGVAGYSLGGGIGWYARTLGMATNSLTAVELVTADGVLRRVDADHDPELFWALRGGGGNFGVVTALEFRLYPITSAYAGMLIWDWTEAERVLTRWAEWSTAAPDEVTTSFRIMQLPPIEEVPEPFRGRQLVMIDGAVLGDDETGERVLAGLRELEPEMDLFGRMPAPALGRLHGDPEGPTPGVGDHTLLASLPSEAIAALLAAAGPGSGSRLAVAELRQLGGSLGRPHPGGGVMGRIEGAYALFAATMAPTPEAVAAGKAEAAAVVAACAPWSQGRAYLNFTEHAVDPSAAYGPEALDRLVAVRRRVDPAGIFRANHPVG